jgi:spore coat protein U-like protein
MKTRHLLGTTAAIALGAFAFGHGALAVSPASTTFNINATVANACTVSASDIGFTTIATGQIATSGTNGIKVTCTADGTYDVGMMGTNSGASALGVGNLVNGANTPIPYTLYQNSAASTVWGNTPGANTVTGQSGCSGTGTGNCTGTGSEQDYEVWAKLGTVPGTLHLGTYSDIVTVSVNYY